MLNAILRRGVRQPLILLLYTDRIALWEIDAYLVHTRKRHAADGIERKTVPVARSEGRTLSDHVSTQLDSHLVAPCGYLIEVGAAELTAFQLRVEFPYMRLGRIAKRLLHVFSKVTPRQLAILRLEFLPPAEGNDGLWAIPLHYRRMRRFVREDSEYGSVAEILAEAFFIPFVGEFHEAAYGVFGVCVDVVVRIIHRKLVVSLQFPVERSVVAAAHRIFGIRPFGIFHRHTSPAAAAGPIVFIVKPDVSAHRPCLAQHMPDEVKPLFAHVLDLKSAAGIDHPLAESGLNRFLYYLPRLLRSGLAANRSEQNKRRIPARAFILSGRIRS